MEEQLIRAGVKNLKEFGYPAVDKDNILTDLVYSSFFKRMLETTKEAAKGNKSVTSACDNLLSKIECTVS
jgi:hypothetical protein